MHLDWSFRESSIQSSSRPLGDGFYRLVVQNLFNTLKLRGDALDEFAPELSGKGPKEHFIVLEPGGTRLELSYDPK